MRKHILDYYAKPAKMTTFSAKQLPSIHQLPDGIKPLTTIVQGLLIHLFVAESFYHVQLDPKRIDVESNLRPVNQILETILTLDESPLTCQRPPEKRAIGACHHFGKLLTSLLRVKGIPARMRYGFGRYFRSGFFEDHSLVEVWNQPVQKWSLVDPQFDQIWIKKMNLSHDIYDVPRDQFIMPAEAWQKCRSGVWNAHTFGTSNGEMNGLWFIAGNMIKDLAALNRMEMLQWDAWVSMPRPNNTMKDSKRLAFFDNLAELLSDPDNKYESLQALYGAEQNKVHVPQRVFNAMRRHLEVI